LDQYLLVAGEDGGGNGEAFVSRERDPGTVSEVKAEAVTETIAALHHRRSITGIDPAELDPDLYLRGVVITADSSVSTRDRFRARHLLDDEEPSATRVLHLLFNVESTR
jgi:hypothetical protein